MDHKLKEPGAGRWITTNKEGLGFDVPDSPVIGYIEGDGVGPDIWAASRPVFDSAVMKAYKGSRKIYWWKIYAGAESFKEFGSYFPEESFEAIKKCVIAIKGPLTTPVGGGFRSLNVTLRQKLDLYACVRPVKYVTGTPSPMIRPEDVDMVVFRENTEDVYAGIEWKSGSVEAVKMINFLEEEMGIHLPLDSGIGVKPMSPSATKRLVRMAFKYAIDNRRKRVTLVHKGNIMKFTEGAFRDWGYETVRAEFPDIAIFEEDLFSKFGGRIPDGKILVNDRIADAMFQQALLRPQEYEVLITPNLNGDYISDALAAQVGGLGMAPGANIGDTCSVFEATHGSAPKYAGQDKVNPGSMLLSGAMMFRRIGWDETAELIERALAETIQSKIVTYDLARLTPGSKEVSCSGFGKAIKDRIEKN
ncbi:MAG: isocitrate dehydrogenase (NADP(+)) [Desulfomonilaceae bacterium]|jgi:isocitrate dehydrogenase